MWGCLPESLTNKQILFSLCRKACLLTAAFPCCPAPAHRLCGNSWVSWVFLDMQSREVSQDSRVHLKQTKHWSSCPLHLTHALSQADHGHRPAEDPRGAALCWVWSDMGSPCPKDIYCFFREGITSSCWHQFPESSWPTKLVVTPILHPFQDSESVSQAFLSPEHFLNAFMMLVIPSSCFFPQEKRGLGLIKLCCQLSGSGSWFALQHEFLTAPMCKTRSGFCFFRKKTPIPPPLPLTPYTIAQSNTTFQIPGVHKTKEKISTPYIGVNFSLGTWKTCHRTAVNRQQHMLHTEFLSLHV